MQIFSSLILFTSLSLSLSTIYKWIGWCDVGLHFNVGCNSVGSGNGVAVVGFCGLLGFCVSY